MAHGCSDRHQGGGGGEGVDEADNRLIKMRGPIGPSDIFPETLDKTCSTKSSEYSIKPHNIMTLNLTNDFPRFSMVCFISISTFQSIRTFIQHHPQKLNGLIHCT